MIASGVEIETPVSPLTGKKPFEKLHNLPAGTNLVILIGGRGGMKSYECSKYIAKTSTIDARRCAILRDEQSKIKNSILNEIYLRYDEANKYGHLNNYFEKQENSIKDRKTRREVVFTMGFRASSNINTAGLKSVSDVDTAVIEEAEDIRDVYKFNAFSDGIRKEGYLIIIVLNTPDINHWIVKRYFNAIAVKGHDGYFELIPKGIEGFVCIQTSYQDNPHLPKTKVTEYENYGNPNSHTYDLHYYLTAIKGYASSGRKGQILTKVKPIKLADYMALPFPEVYGQDYGTGSHAPLGGFKFNGNNSYIRGIDYDPKDTLAIGKLYARVGFGKNHKVISDSAEPETIKKLQDGWKHSELEPADYDMYPQLLKGFYIVPAIKGPGSVETSIGILTGMNLFAVEESTDVWEEINNWIYDVDKNNNPTDKPKKGYDHYMACWRYVATDYKGLPSKKLQTAYFR